MSCLTRLWPMAEETRFLQACSSAASFNPTLPGVTQVQGKRCDEASRSDYFRVAALLESRAKSSVHIGLGFGIEDVPCSCIHLTIPSIMPPVPPMVSEPVEPSTAPCGPSPRVKVFDGALETFHSTRCESWIGGPRSSRRKPRRIIQQQRCERTPSASTGMPGRGMLFVKTHGEIRPSAPRDQVWSRSGAAG
ncbi:hypothetical protein M011DRAFT_254998 [Sporormia fimetaria CBS 119925]|uniref:Uncharacterized protein n=1 Tax=Sporormia fimetaria CBS 119925 TaxID=1340428 RepID=A0A6A6V0M8_9PLEO|nr:hypothetical protein M011DRAFT_254998 [Sporormia fimetaria CBS 119925]